MQFIVNYQFTLYDNFCIMSTPILKYFSLSLLSPTQLGKYTLNNLNKRIASSWFYWFKNMNIITSTVTVFEHIEIISYIIQS